MCLCCCPPAITALLCLWVRNGFSKASVAGALTFFPPDPPLYKFSRHGKDGEELPDDDEEEADGDKKWDKDEVADEAEQLFDGGDAGSVPESRHVRQPMEISRGEGGGRRNSSSKKKKKKERSNDGSAASALTERQKKLEEKAAIRYKRDRADADAGVKFDLRLVEAAMVPSRFESYVERMEAVKLHNKKARSFIAAVVYRCTPPTNKAEGAKSSSGQASGTKDRSHLTILYSHGNATDIGAMSLMQCYMARGLGVNVVMYDYSGYGESGGVPLENNTYSDIETVYSYVLEKLANNNPRNVIIYGQSVGSGPSVYLTTRKPTGGLILHSPFLSGMRVLTPSRALACLDIYPNIDRIKRVKCPVLVIHGAQDEEVEMHHGVGLHEAVPSIHQRDPWWVADRGHNDICDGSSNMNEYLRRLRTFLDSLDPSP